ncbi:MAG: serine hydrolase [Gemmataceae bacterium]|nr:serine hydrolase [Gemmataceae bacterium]
MRAAVLLLGLLTPAAAWSQLPTARALDGFFQDSLKEWKAPGLAVAIVDADRILYAKGFGFREAGKPERMTADAIFPFASCTKTLTVAALGRAREDDKLAWDDPLRKHLPWFRLQDEYAGKHATLRDALCHRIGLGGHDLLWYGRSLTMNEKTKSLALLPFDHPFRSQFDYQAIAFGAAGLALESAVGESWDAYLQRRILTPLGMTRTTTRKPKEGSDVAVGHRRSPAGDPVAIAPYLFEHPDPAGSVHTTVRDSAEFLRLLLRKGEWKGERVLAEKTIAEMLTPQVVIRREGLAKTMTPDATMMAYGLGWVIQDYHGVTICQHGGAIDGYRIHLLLVPEANLGAVFCCNMDGVSMNLALSHALLDAALGRTAKNWNAYYRELDQSKLDERIAHFAAIKKREAPPALPLAAYAGRYEDRAYGATEISVADGKLTAKRGAWRIALESLGTHRFYVTTDPAAGGLAEFVIRDGAPVELQLFDQTFRKTKSSP